MLPFGLLPGLDLGRLVAYGVAILAVVAVLVGYGYHLGLRELWEYQAEQARAAVPIVRAQGEVTVRTVTEYRDRIVKVKGETEYIIEEVPVYVPAAADPVLGRGWVHLHDAAASRTVPDPAGRADAAAPELAASQAIKGVVANYGTCHAIGAQLVSLQQWVCREYRVANLQALRMPACAED